MHNPQSQLNDSASNFSGFGGMSNDPAGLAAYEVASTRSTATA